MVKGKLYYDITKYNVKKNKKIIDLQVVRYFFVRIILT